MAGSTDTEVQEDDTLAWAERWLSAERLAPYLAACDDDIDAALDLYDWNQRLGQALQGDISRFEVALRNACDRAMTEGWGESWLMDNESPVRKPVMRSSGRGLLDVNRINRNAIQTAELRLPSGFSHGSLVAGLTLGFWVHLSDRTREVELWRTYLHKAWPKGTKRPELQRALDGILRVRNRVTHNERLFDPKRAELSPVAADKDCVRLLGQLCPEAAERLYGNDDKTPVERFVGDNPAPAAVRL